jgi:glycosyltransferase involved in cell wall biosynthesis
VTGPKPFAVFIGKAQLPGPRSSLGARRAALVDPHLRSIWVKTGRMGIERGTGSIHLSLPVLRPRLLGGLVFYTAGPVVAVAATLGRGPCAVVCQSPLEGFGVILLSRLLPRRVRPRVQVEVHGDWRTAPRLYGGRVRRLLGPLSDRLCAWAVRHADRLRLVSDAMSRQAHEAGFAGPTDQFIEFGDYSTFLEQPPRPLPSELKVMFIGVLERYKGVDVLLSAWPGVTRMVPRAELLIVGTGTMAPMLQRTVTRLGVQDSVSFLGHVEPDVLRYQLDRSWCLVLPSRSEGLGRVVIEAMARARPVVASSVGGLAEVVEDGRTGYLVTPDHAPSLTAALVKVLQARDQTEAMGLEGRRRVIERDPMTEYEEGVGRLARWIGAVSE